MGTAILQVCVVEVLKLAETHTDEAELLESIYTAVTEYCAYLGNDLQLSSPRLTGGTV